MSDIPPEIIRDILSRLPVKSLLRFRCVSKPWRSMIDTKDFIKLHLRHSYNTNSNRTLLVDSTQLFYIDLDSFERLDIGDTQFEPQTVACSCDGLVLIVFKFNNIVLWNPATRKLNKLPATPLECQISVKANCVDERYALGYDSKHDDYKVVRVIQASTRVDGGCLSSETKIYSLRSNSWKQVEDFPYMLPSCKRWGVYLNDALHTVVKDSQCSEVIMAFNVAKEEHYEVPKPRVNRGLSSVEVMGGCLTAIVPGKRNSSEIWAMKEYGVKKSWAKLLCFEPPLRDPCLNLCPLAYSKSGDEVLLNYEGMCLNWYNLKKKTVSFACVPGLTASFYASPHDPPFQAEFCVGSLVSPHSPAGPGDERQGKKGKLGSSLCSEEMRMENEVDSHKVASFLRVEVHWFT
ncbi:hypothetical protein BUALT_Bualt03G0085800 [Buddleja alternifolia]|uniref:F-box domain-containing protein n=1 Tax=Buddleja alternifolia TaxID=168488 RepID=A0AAV6XUA8_9LAMI|nr:hypothetical protein BUALT_Bualt03G0085800 [Buddleja alternifolia]